MPVLALCRWPHLITGLVIGLAGPLAITVSGCREGAQRDADALLQEAREKLATDHRTVVFDVQGSVTGGMLTLRGEIQNASLKEDLLKYLKKHGHFTVVESLMVLPDPALGTRTYGVVSLSVANIRTSPDHGAEMGTQAILGTPVKVLKKRHGWFYVQTPDEYLGWTDDPVVRMDDSSYRAWTDRPKVIVTAPFGWVREAPSDNSQPVSDVVAGSLLAVVGKGRTHYELDYPDGRRGFLPLREGAPFDHWLSVTHDTPESIVATAKQYKGVPYLWGGTSAKGMDCSGFTKTVYFLNGVLLPRDADQQASVGDPVEVAGGIPEFRAGDLLFFGRRASEGKGERVTHVAISLGGARFIHASGDVHMNSLSPADTDFSNYRSESFLRARRIIGAGEASGVRRLLTIPYYRTNEP
ncbi:MAG: C40 family peptidase [Bacteroidota bacterium]